MTEENVFSEQHVREAFGLPGGAILTHTRGDELEDIRAKLKNLARDLIDADDIDAAHSLLGAASMVGQALDQMDTAEEALEQRTKGPEVEAQQSTEGNRPCSSSPAEPVTSPT